MASNTEVFKKMEITLDDSNKVSVAVNMTEVPDFKELPSNKCKKALQDWIKKKYTSGLAPKLQYAPDPQAPPKGTSDVISGAVDASSASSMDTHLPMEVTTTSCKHGFNLSQDNFFA